MSGEKYIAEGWQGEDNSNHRSNPPPPPAGIYIVPIEIVACTIEDKLQPKPYLQLKNKILPFLDSSDSVAPWAVPEQSIFHEFPSRVYLNQKAERWARWFFKKAGYDETLLEEKRIRPLLLVGVRMLYLITVTEQGGFIKIDVDGYAHFLGDDSLKMRWAKKSESPKEGSDLPDIPWDAGEEESGPAKDGRLDEDVVF